MILPPDIDGKITLTLHEVPWRTALEQVVRLAGCELTEEAHGILRVVKPETVEKVLRVYDVRDLRLASPQEQTEAPDPDYLPAGSRYAVYRGWSAETTLTLTAGEQAFLDAAGGRLREAEAAEAARQQHELDLERRSVRRLRSLVAV